MEADYYVADIMKLERLQSYYSPSTDYQGIITFPSFHTVLGILFIWVSWPNFEVYEQQLFSVNGLMIFRDTRSRRPLCCGRHRRSRGRVRRNMGRQLH